MFFFLQFPSFDWTITRPDDLSSYQRHFILTELLWLTDQQSSQILQTFAFQFLRKSLRTYHSDILVSTVKVLHFTKTDFNWVLSYVFNPNESSIILFTSPQVLWRHKDYWRLSKLALKKKPKKHNKNNWSHVKMNIAAKLHATNHWVSSPSYLLPNFALLFIVAIVSFLPSRRDTLFFNLKTAWIKAVWWTKV